MSKFVLAQPVDNEAVDHALNRYHLLTFIFSLQARVSNEYLRENLAVVEEHVLVEDANKSNALEG